ncbi:hypothetical protein ACFYYL_18215 [Actinomadura geliboluensis]|uniref:hypothetical protein n=1 Tax=Actinomadura geliboluensis TaxID=882440 RepID=UPI0036B57543
MLLVLPLASCGGGQPSAATPSVAPAAASPKQQVAAQPKTEATVRKVAQEEFDAYAAGEYGEAWELWTAAGKSMISRANYEKLHELCKTVTGLRFAIEKIRVLGNTATVRVSRSIAVLSYKFLYEQGQWRFVPDKDSATDYRYARKAGVAKLVARKKAEGGCTS